MKFEIPEGAVLIHMYNVKNILRPRGTMLKESLGAYILDKLEGAYESWTDEKYGDNPTEDELLQLLHTNLVEETDAAYAEFIRRLLEKRTKQIPANTP